MNTQSYLFLFIIIAGVLIIAGIGFWYANRKSNSKKLREKFGPEYDYTLQKSGDQRTAEETLKERESRVVDLDIRPLAENERDRYRGEWTAIQSDFVDDPSKSVKEANRLITEVMIARGFPVADFEQRAADLSVMYPNFVSSYRQAHTIALKNDNNQASTEELRQAMVYDHSLYDELLGTVEGNPTEMEIAK